MESAAFEKLQGQFKKQRSIRESVLPQLYGVLTTRWQGLGPLREKLRTIDPGKVSNALHRAAVKGYIEKQFERAAAQYRLLPHHEAVQPPSLDSPVTKNDDLEEQQRFDSSADNIHKLAEDMRHMANRLRDAAVKVSERSRETEKLLAAARIVLGQDK